MPSLKRILFPVDFSERCEQMAPSARAWAERFQAEVILLHCVNLPPHPEHEFTSLREALRKQILAAAQGSLQDFTERHFTGLETAQVIRETDPAWAIPGEVDKKRIHLIMMPTHGHGAFRRFLVGSVTSKVLHDARCAVWTTAHAERPKAQRYPPRTIVCGVDSGGGTVRLIRWAQWLADRHGAALKLVHALPAVDETSENRGEKAVRRHWTRKAREELTPLVAQAGCESELLLRGGGVADVLAASVVEERADLLVIGRGHLKQRLGRLRTHSLAIVVKSPCPVISV